MYGCNFIVNILFKLKFMSDDYKHNSDNSTRNKNEGNVIPLNKRFRPNPIKPTRPEKPGSNEKKNKK